MKKPVAQFDLNSRGEPSDEQLVSLMDAVAEEVRRQAKTVEAQLKENLETAVRQTKDRFSKR